MPGTTLTHLGAESPPPRPPPGVLEQRFTCVPVIRACFNVRCFSTCLPVKCRNQLWPHLSTHDAFIVVRAIKIQCIVKYKLKNKGRTTNLLNE